MLSDYHILYVRVYKGHLNILQPPKTPNKAIEKEARVQNNLQSSPKLQKSERPKRSRVAAKFVSPPATNGSEQ